MKINRGGNSLSSYFRVMALPKIEQGKLILAEPFLHDPYFKRAVVLLTEHSKQGTMGFVVNMPSEIVVSDAIKDFPKTNMKVYYGGPVDQDIVFYVHTLGEKVPNSIQIKKGIFWGGDFNKIQELANNKELNNNNIRFYIGYAGWGPAQFREELKKNAWFIYPAKSEYIFNKAPRRVWGKILRDHKSPFSVLSNFYETPSLN